MKLRLRRQESVRGEWSVLDLVRGYRICQYNHPHHGGTHVHHPETSAPRALVDVDTMREAEIVMRRFHEEHDTFDVKKLQEVIDAWKSESAAG